MLVEQTLVTGSRGTVQQHKRQSSVDFTFKGNVTGLDRRRRLSPRLIKLMGHHGGLCVAFFTSQLPCANHHAHSPVSCPTKSSRQLGSFSIKHGLRLNGTCDLSCMRLLSWPMRTGFDDLESRSARCVEDSSPIAAPSNLTTCSLVQQITRTSCTIRAFSMSTKSLLRSRASTAHTFKMADTRLQHCFLARGLKNLLLALEALRSCAPLSSCPSLGPAKRRPCLTVLPHTCLSVWSAALCLPHP